MMTRLTHPSPPAPALWPLALLAACAAVIPLPAQDYDCRDWFKGNTHTHTLWSDGNDFPESVIDWYRKHGYHFVALSDHNVLQEGEKWMSVSAIKKRQRAIGRDAITKCEARFGKDWIRWEERDGEKGLFLKTLDQCRERFEEPGKFHLVPAEEISNARAIHVNALNLRKVIPAVKDENLEPTEVIQATLDRVKAHAESTGEPILAHINHPNFRWALTPEDLAAVAEGGFVEIYNGHPGINHLGDEERPGEVRAWDIANTIRLAEMEAPPLLGVATDDSHTYHGGDVRPGRGWIHVGAESLDSSAIVRAMQEGKFYASSGVLLERIAFDPEKRVLTLEIADQKGTAYTTEFVGTRAGYDASADKDTGIGEVFATEEGRKVSCRVPDDAYYLRATVTSSRKHPDPSFPGQREQAWTQPVGWRE